MSNIYITYNFHAEIQEIGSRSEVKVMVCLTRKSAAARTSLKITQGHSNLHSSVRRFLKLCLSRTVSEIIYVE